MLQAIVIPHGRVIGIRHRIKATAQGETRPTQVAIITSGEKPVTLDLEDENAELDFMLGRFPSKYRQAEADEDLSKFNPRHIKTRKSGEEEKVSVPSEYEGLRSGDTVAMVLGGSGDNFAFALARRSQEIGSRVLRIPPIRLKDNREDQEDKDSDANLLAQLAIEKPELFYAFRPRDAQLINVREAVFARTEAMKARMATGQRLRQQLVGRVFRNETGRYPEGSIEELYDQEVANDLIFKAVKTEESRRNADLQNALEALDIYTELFKPIEGCGPAIGGGIIATIVDIRRFETVSKLRAFMGVHVLPDGTFPRKRRGTICNWNPRGRQALFLLGDQFVKRKNSHWGQVLRAEKLRYRAIHPEEIIDERGKKKYTNGHIHKMAIWSTLGQFVEWLCKEWWKIEERHLAKPEPQSEGGENSDAAVA